MMHDYQPDPRTGQCQGCTGAMGGCAWCGHRLREHGGRPDPAVLAHYAYIVRVANRTETRSRVKWSASACSAPHCACRRYEH